MFTCMNRFVEPENPSVQWNVIAGIIHTYDETGNVVGRFRWTNEKATDDSELLAQGRFKENSDRKRVYNACPYIGDDWHRKRLTNLQKKDKAMMAFPSMIAGAAKRAGMKVPDDPDGEYSREEFPHFWVFCTLQLCRPMQPGEHWENAEIIAAIPEDELKTMTLNDFFDKGLRYST